MICLNADCVVLFIKIFERLENNGTVVFLKPDSHILYVCNNILLSKGDQCGRFLFYVIKKNQENQKQINLVS